ncbi:protein FAR1-RELATED SEQUENCE 3-like [Diospyros lotus]|uniref:protein FAR1-RELATED SEQUENCE 3-like n=1 Tax=Diospyros lotus TaxID=55363 RepID=UPI00225199CA|nr:protein FAR1-RELATED SEQUENCE 3-like [Diospyros lotus]
MSDIENHTVLAESFEDNERTLVDNEQIIEDNECPALNNELLEDDNELIPNVGMKFNDEKEVFEFYKRYAYHVGFLVKRRSSKKGDDGQLEVNDITRIPLHKSFNSTIVEAGGYENLTFVEKDCRNYTDQQFVEQYEWAMRCKVEKEFQADIKSFSQMIPSALKYPMEKQFQEVYTMEKFKEIQEEFIGTMYCTIVSAKEGSLGTSCHMFEFKGIICRHVVTILIHNGVISIPKRWKLQVESKIFSAASNNLTKDMQEQLM